jgi:hypothetical protein
MSVAVKERKSSEPVMSAAEQTRLSWARTVQSLEELPPAYHSFFADGPLPYAVLTPTFAGFMRRETERLVYCLDDRLIILEKTPGEPKCTAFSLDDLNYVEVGGVLLRAWIKFQGRANAEQALTTVTLRFNAVTDRLFAPFVDRIRGTAASPIDFPRDVELSKLDDDAVGLSFKFRNYARHSLLPGDRVVAAIGQPEMRRPVIRIGHWTYQRTMIVAHMLLLTDRELIIIRDDPESPRSFDETRYGGVWDYIPLRKIERIAWQITEADVLTVTLDLPWGDRVDMLFAAARRAEVEGFFKHVLEWAPEATLHRA